MPNTPLKVFISYAHEDEPFKNDLVGHLKTLSRQGKIEIWQDRDMLAGDRWDPEIKKSLEEADIVLLLISVNFINSNYIDTVELKRTLEREAEGRVRMIPILLKPTDLQGTEIRKLQALPKDGKPISKWDDKDDAYLNVVRGIRRVVDSLWDKPRASTRSLVEQSVSTQPDKAAMTDTSVVPSLLQKRLAIANRLTSMLKGDFDQLLFVLDVPQAYVPSPTLSQQERANQFLTWATKSGGFGLDDLNNAIDAILKR